MSHSRSYSLSVAGCSIAIQEFGSPEGMPVIALHGWLDNSASFWALSDHLIDVRLIALDLIGHGESSFRPKGMPYHIWDNVTDLHAVLTQLSLQKVCILGHSMGASIATLFSGAFPDRVQRLMCIEGLAPLHYEVETLPKDFSKAIEKRSKMATKRFKTYTCREEAILSRMNGRWSVTREAAEKLLERGLSKTADGTYRWSHDPNLLSPSLVRLSPDQIRSFLKSVKAPTTVVKGSEGAAYLMDGWVDELQYYELVELKGGHHLHMEAHAAGKIASIINSWVK